MGKDKKWVTKEMLAGLPAGVQKWMEHSGIYKNFQGIRIPYNSKVIWKLKERDFNWLNVALIDLEYNRAIMYR